MIRGPALMSVAADGCPQATANIARRRGHYDQLARLGGTVRVTLRSPAGYRRTVPFTVTGHRPVRQRPDHRRDRHRRRAHAGRRRRRAVPAGTGCRGLPPHRGTRPGQRDPAPGRRRAGRAAALARHIHRHPYDAYRTAVPTALVSFGESANFPLLLGAIIVLCGAATLAHLLAVSVRRRRRENGLLSSLGFVRRQLGEILFWQASTVAVAGLLAGVPLGLVAGHAIWRAFAANLGVVGVVGAARGRDRASRGRGAGGGEPSRRAARPGRGPVPGGPSPEVRVVLRPE